MHNSKMYIYFIIVKLTIICRNNPAFTYFFFRFNFGLTLRGDKKISAHFAKGLDE